MPSENDGIMIILSSPSGAGKTTLVNLLSKLDNFKFLFHILHESLGQSTDKVLLCK